MELDEPLIGNKDDKILPSNKAGQCPRTVYRHGSRSQESKPSRSASGVDDMKEGGGQRTTDRPSRRADAVDVRAMEQGLLQLLSDFRSGELSAFSDGTTLERMDQLREHQDRLARMHFQLDVHQNANKLDTEEFRTAADSNLSTLIEQLHDLSASIQSLPTGCREGKSVRRDTKDD